MRFKSVLLLLLLLVVVVVSMRQWWAWQQPSSSTAADYRIFDFVPGMPAVDCSGRGWTELPPGFVAYMKRNRVQVLFLSQNAFASVPLELAQLGELRMLSMRQNQLTTVDCSALPQSSLVHLVLTDNRIARFVGGCRFPRLKKLMLARNALHELDPLLVVAPELELLRLSQNRFSTLPVAWLSKATQLKWASFGDNPCCPCDTNNSLADLTDSMDCPNASSSSVVVVGKGTSGTALVCNQGQRVFKRFNERSSDGSKEYEMQVSAQLPRHNPAVLFPLGMARLSPSSSVGLVFPRVAGQQIGTPPTFGSEDGFVGTAKYSLARVELAVHEAACGLRDIHRARVSHGDLYAHNALMKSSSSSSGGGVVLLDFGAATCLTGVAARQAMFTLDSRAFAVFVRNMRDSVVVDKPSSSFSSSAYLNWMLANAQAGMDAELLCEHQTLVDT